MKNIFKTGKRSIAAILTLCILLGIAGTCVYAASVMPEENPTATEETTPGLVPVMARGCGYGDLTSWYNIDHETKSLILSDVTGNYSAVVGKNPDIYYGSNGLIYLCGTGSYSGRTYTTDLQRSWYL